MNIKENFIKLQKKKAPKSSYYISKIEKISEDYFSNKNYLWDVPEKKGELLNFANRFIKKIITNKKSYFENPKNDKHQHTSAFYIYIELLVSCINFNSDNLQSILSHRGSFDVKVGNLKNKFDNVKLLDPDSKINLVAEPNLSIKDTLEKEISKQNKIEAYVSILKNAYNIILHGAPGTGKTYMAYQIAEILCGLDQIKDEGLKKKKRKERIKMIQFHPSYDYTDFMEGLRPVKKKGISEIGFERKDGVFKTICKRALGVVVDKDGNNVYINNIVSDNIESQFIYPSDDKSIIPNNNNYVLIIDEINRGEISKILGEGMFSIDPGYAGKSEKRIDTQYQNLIEDENDPFKDGFYRPENVFIIGTMNDIDRGVESMDLAMRRRFLFKEVKATDTQDEILSQIDDKDRKVAKKAMDELNKAIRNQDGLFEDYCIGASYFLKLDEKDENKWTTLWNNHLKGLLKEYLRGMEGNDEKFMLLYDAYKKAVNINESANGQENEEKSQSDSDNRNEEISEANSDGREVNTPV